jgi:hypothetical protein
LAATLGFFFVSLVSVWCFFAAVGSAILVAYFFSPEARIASRWRDHVAHS